MTRTTCRLLGGLLALVLGPSTAAAQPMNVCARSYSGGYAEYVPAHLAMTRSTRGTTWNPSDYQPWATHVHEFWHRTWEAWWYLDTTNPAVWIDDSTTTPVFAQTADGVSVIHRRGCASGTPPCIGGGNAPHYSVGGAIFEGDIGMSGATALSTGTFTATHNVVSCVFPYNINTGLTSAAGDRPEAPAVMHEFGHMYGYADFGSWLSIMNPTAQNAHGCELGTSPGPERSMWMNPPGEGMRCHDLVYGVPGVDLSVIAFWQNTADCAGLGVSCSTVDNSLVTFTTQTSYTGPNLRFTTFSNLASITGWVGVQARLSRDRAWSADDVALGSVIYTTTGWLSGDTVTRSLPVYFNPQTALPLVGTTYFLLLKIDYLDSFSENRETNNVTDTGLRFRRN